MKTENEIKDRILELEADIVALHMERDYYMEKYQGLTEEKNADYHADITWKINEIQTLEWVLGKREIKRI